MIRFRRRKDAKLVSAKYLDVHLKTLTRAKHIEETKSQEYRVTTYSECIDALDSRPYINNKLIPNKTIYYIYIEEKKSGRTVWARASAKKTRTTNQRERNQMCYKNTKI